jgi:hypothetical protein
VKGTDRRTAAQGWPRAKTQDPIQKITKGKRAGGMTQVVEHKRKHAEITGLLLKLLMFSHFLCF